jgi:2-dehydropantoate 2-reductase
MKVGILGAGAMGSLFGGGLARAGHEVWFVDIWDEHVGAIESDGLRMTYEGGERRAQGRATTSPSDVGPVDLLMVWCKSTATAEAVAGAVGMVGPQTVVSTFQNGLGNVEAIERVVAPSQIVYGVTTGGARIEGPGHIELTEGSWEGASRTWMRARVPDGGALVGPLVAALEEAGLPAEEREDVDTVIWSKLAMASTMAGVTALTRLRIGDVLDTEGAPELIRAMTVELVAVAQAAGVPLDAEEAVRRNLETYATVRGHVSSMLQDVLSRRPTEMSALSGAVVREGRRLGVPTPRHEVVSQLVTMVEQHYAEQLLGT